MQLSIIYLQVCFLLVYCLCQMNKVTLTDPTAVCLDGSPGIYYLSRGTNPKSVVIYFEGGGWCGDKDLSSTIENCYQRSKTNMGSTRNDSAVINPVDGIYSNNINNHFRDSTKVYLRYCDGAGHQGSRSSPIVYKDASLYFRGNNITVAQLDDLDKKQSVFSQADQIIVTGGSAGGLAAFLWADYVKDRAKTKKVFSAPDSGIFLDSAVFGTVEHLYSTQFENIFKLSNTQFDPPVADCVKAYRDTPYKCMMVQYMAPYLKTPTFPIQSLYDSWSIPNILNIKCLSGSSLANCNQKQLDYIEQYRQNTTNVLKEIADKTGNGGWGLGCATHGFVHDGRYYGLSYRIPMNSGNSIDATLLKWVHNQAGADTYIDTQPWPANKPCSGTAIKNFDLIYGIL